MKCLVQSARLVLVDLRSLPSNQTFLGKDVAFPMRLKETSPSSCVTRVAIHSDDWAPIVSGWKRFSFRSLTMPYHCRLFRWTFPKIFLALYIGWKDCHPKIWDCVEKKHSASTRTLFADSPFQELLPSRRSNFAQFFAFASSLSHFFGSKPPFLDL
jgi:hypothetical protein